MGKIFLFRVTESHDAYFVCKSLDADKKSHNVVGILPKILISKHQAPSFVMENFTFQGLIID